MNKVGRIQKVIVLSGMVMVGVVASVFGQTEDSLANRLPRRFVHGLGVEARPEYVFLLILFEGRKSGAETDSRSFFYSF